MAQTNRIPPGQLDSYKRYWIDSLTKTLSEFREHEIEREFKELKLGFFGDTSIIDFIDFEIHRLLALLFMKSRKFDLAIEQLQLIRSKIPSDPVTAHLLGIGYLEKGEEEMCQGVLDEIELVSSDIAKWNDEWAGLKGRMLRQKWKKTGDRDYLERACNVYETVLSAYPDSYYMADAAGQANLLLGNKERAKTYSKKVLEITSELKKPTLWSLASRASALIIANDLNELSNVLTEINDLHPDERAKQTIKKTIQELSELTEINTKQQEKWIKILVAN